jgi:DNA end-binding protein Ku
LVDVKEFKSTPQKPLGKAELRMAEQLVKSMTTAWNPEQFTDDYREALENLIEEKIEHGDKAAPPVSKRKRPPNVVDLVSVLQESIEQTRERTKVGKRTRIRKAEKKASKKAGKPPLHQATQSHERNRQPASTSHWTRSPSDHRAVL